MVVVITGSMGCGKTTVTRLLSEQLPNYTVINFDSLVHELYLDESIQQHLMAAFGTCVRSQIRDIVFTNQVAMAKLHSIVNSRLYELINTIHPESNTLLDMPLWFEYKHLIDITPDLVVCVTCPDALQKERIRNRDNISDDLIQSKLALQLPKHVKEANSDIVIYTHSEWMMNLDITRVCDYIKTRSENP